MTRPEQEGGQTTAQAGAEDSLTELVNVTNLARELPQTDADRRSHAADFAHFAQTGRTSYLREYLPGELHPLMVAAQPDGAPSHVAVAYVCAGERVRVFLWPDHDHAEGLERAEAAADAERIKRALRGEA